jgi:hypothetical protein
VSIDRNAPCPCFSGKKLKHCCLDAHMAWHRAGKGIVAYYVRRKKGAWCPISAWNLPITGRTDVIAELNPVMSSWVRNTLPSVDRFGHPMYRDLLLQHLVAMAGGAVPQSVVEDVADEFSAARDFLTFKLARPAAGTRTGGSPRIGEERAPLSAS